MRFEQVLFNFILKTQHFENAGRFMNVIASKSLSN